MASRSPIQLGELLISVALTGLGIFVVATTQDISAGGGYSQVGPRAFPYLIGAGLIFLGGILCWQAVSGGWRNTSENKAHEQPDWLAFALLSGGIILHMAMIGWAGFVLTSAFLFVLIARAFGSGKLLRDTVIGLILSTIAYFIFTRALGLNLPSGFLMGA